VLWRRIWEKINVITLGLAVTPFHCR
jgi:hypothetical protein